MSSLVALLIRPAALKKGPFSRIWPDRKAHILLFELASRLARSSLIALSIWLAALEQAAFLSVCSTWEVCSLFLLLIRHNALKPLSSFNLACLRTNSLMTGPALSSSYTPSNPPLVDFPLDLASELMCLFQVLAARVDHDRVSVSVDDLQAGESAWHLLLCYTHYYVTLSCYTHIIMLHTHYCYLLCYLCYTHINMLHTHY